MGWPDELVEHVVGYASPLGNPPGLVECPMNAQVNAALPVLLFRLGERGKAPWNKRANVPSVILRHAVKFIGDKSESDGVGSVETAQDLEERAAEPSMA